MLRISGEFLWRQPSSSSTYKAIISPGKMELVHALEAVQKACMILQCFREHNGHHVHLQHISKKPDATFLVPGDLGTGIHNSVAHFEGEPIVYKSVN